MSSKTNELVRNLTEAIVNTGKKKTSPYDTSATVNKVEGGKAYVHIPGGVDETPADLTINANPGDTVQVRVAGGRAFLIGNRTSPPTDDATAIRASKRAVEAYEQAVDAQKSALDAADAAEAAQESADQAAEAAADAQESADTAHTAAVNAQADADSAQSGATSALNSANNALTQLSIVEDVAGTLNWIREHGAYVATTDTTVNPDTIYFEMEGEDYVPIANPDPSANPASEGWYILDVTDSQSEYIMAHLAVTSAGLWVLPSGQWVGHSIVDSDGNIIVDSSGDPIVDWTVDPQNAIGYKVLLSASGMTVFDGNGEAVASYGAETIIGLVRDKHVRIDNDSVDIMDGNDVIAEFGEKTIIGNERTKHMLMSDNLFGVYSVDGLPIFLLNSGTGTETSSSKYLTIKRYYCEAADESKNELTFEIDLMEFGITALTADKLPDSTPYVFVNGDKLPTDSSYYNYVILADTEEDSVTGETVITAITLTLTLYPTYNQSGKFETDDSVRICLTMGASSITFGYRRAGSAGTLSFSGGEDNLISGDASFAYGRHLVAEYDNQIVFGYYNKNEFGNRLEIGIGMDEDNRANIFKIDNDGVVWAADGFCSSNQAATVTSTKVDTIHLAKRSGFAMLTLINLKNVSAGEQTLFTLPVGYRPPVDVVGIIRAPTDGFFGRIAINRAGNVNLYNYGSAVSGSTNASQTFTYVIETAWTDI